MSWRSTTAAIHNHIHFIWQQQQKLFIPEAMSTGHHRANLSPLRDSARVKKRFLFEWYLQKLPCMERCTPRPYLLGDPVSGAPTVGLPVAKSLSYCWGSYSWGMWYKWLFTLGILQHIQPQPTLTMTIQTRWKKLFAKGDMRTQWYLLCLLSSSEIYKMKVKWAVAK